MFIGLGSKSKSREIMLVAEEIAALARLVSAFVGVLAPYSNSDTLKRFEAALAKHSDHLSLEKELRVKVGYAALSYHLKAVSKRTGYRDKPKIDLAIEAILSVYRLILQEKKSDFQKAIMHLQGDIERLRVKD
ncbi:TPA: hypothetical protein DDW69_04925 [candidate division CPR2 bacterium]|uniref:Uncharacterized protein n=1 Tax=candidate division CPR2 bacterium GW2011_GWC1_41_48 TaxID=1618344 RepID=A0A0G0Z8L2_UNCC2|nr:MAG: hypothetical protein UT47_C0002G0138 [candidate division CPR2 bacterium GW2011_GWC2_39_35]KKS09388.1 MAG: hypothetical protein UU65_C0002G0166 [candidate division CPR2 bacterium GW2011_GWC1_41_48]HBG82144.1 hypothetical protein [candidate division CPR2 bacterium]